MNATDYQQIRQLFDDYVRMYSFRDDLLTTHFSEDFTGFTGGGDFLVKDKAAWVAITRQDFAQVKDPIRLEIKDLAIQSLADSIAVATAFFHIHLPIKDHILSRETARLVLIFRRESAGWMISHSSISIPYHLVREGEVYPMKELVDRNQFLEEQIAERTLQLSEANRHLQQTNEKLVTEAEEKAKLGAQLQQAQKMESLGILVAGVAHNINNVLAIIMGTASVREQGVIEPRDRKAFQTIGKACRRGRDVVSSLMQFARPTLSSQAPIELHALIREVCELLGNTTSKRISIREAFTEGSLWISGDAGTINHSLMNLCINAIDAMPNGGTLTLRTTVPGEGWAEVSVEDSGEGMPPEVQAHALEPFFTTKEVGKGTGLGLSMTYGVIKAHGGTMAISSEPGQGTTVQLRLPSIPAPAPSRKPRAPGPSLESMKVLVVDDEEEVRILMERMLREAPAGQVKGVSGGEEALASLRSGAIPDLIILDQNMPGMDGAQALALIRELQPTLPILIASGQPGVQELDCFQTANVAVISKPFSVDELLAKLARFGSK